MAKTLQQIYYCKIRPLKLNLSDAQQKINIKCQAQKGHTVMFYRHELPVQRLFKLFYLLLGHLAS